VASAELQQLIQMFRARPASETPPTLAEQRAGMEAMVGAMPLPDDVTTTAVDAGGVPGEWVSAPGADSARTDGEDMIHVFQLFPMLPEAREASDRIGAYLAARLSAR
jgi:hypothetical protein